MKIKRYIRCQGDFDKKSNKSLYFVIAILTSLLALTFLSRAADQNSSTQRISNESIILLAPQNTAQTIEHIGSSTGMYSAYLIEQLKRPSDKEKIAKLLFGKAINNGLAEGIGLSCFRVELGGGSADQKDGGGISKAWRQTHSFLKANGRYDWTNAEGADWWIKAAHRYKLSTLIGYANSAPYFMNENGLTYKSEESMKANLRSDKYKDYADYLATIAKNYEKQGLAFDYISPFNEPQWGWNYERGKAKQEGSPWTNQEIYQVTKEIDKAFQNKAIQAKVIVPEAAHIRFLYEQTNEFAAAASDQIKAFWGKASKTSLNAIKSVAPIVTGHTYFVDVEEELVKSRLKLKERIKQEAPHLRFWQSEYSLLDKGYLEDRETHKGMSQMDCALVLAKVIHHDFTITEATSWQFWSSLHPELHGGLPRFNLITAKLLKGKLDLKPTKLLWALGHFSRWVRPGMKRTELKYLNEQGKSLENLKARSRQLMVSSYIEAKTQKRVWVLINTSHQKQSIRLKDSKHYQCYLSNAQVNMRQYQDLKPGQTYQVPARSIITLVSKNQ